MSHRILVHCTNSTDKITQYFLFQGCRVPADMLLLRTTEHTGATFLKTGIENNIWLYNFLNKVEEMFNKFYKY